MATSGPWGPRTARPTASSLISAEVEPSASLHRHRRIVRHHTAFWSTVNICSHSYWRHAPCCMCHSLHCAKKVNACSVQLRASNVTTCSDHPGAPNLSTTDPEPTEGALLSRWAQTAQLMRTWSAELRSLFKRWLRRLFRLRRLFWLAECPRARQRDPQRAASRLGNFRDSLLRRGLIRKAQECQESGVSTLRNNTLLNLTMSPEQRLFRDKSL